MDTVLVRKWNKALSVLSKLGCLSNARRLFEEMPHRNVVTWNTMISGYVRSREIVVARKLFDEMPQRDIVSWNLILSGYAFCHGMRHIEEGRSLFDCMPHRDCVSWNTMISGYARNGLMTEAVCLFDKMPEKNVVSWNAIVTGFLQNGDVERSLHMFERMPVRDSASLGAIVSGLIGNGKLDEAAKLVHRIANIWNEGAILNAYNTLIAGYGQCGRVVEARKLFDQIVHRTLSLQETNDNLSSARITISWNTMIMSYVKAGDLSSARGLFDEMLKRDVISWNTMIHAYVQGGCINEAVKLFKVMPCRDVRSWNSMILGYAQISELGTAREFFDNTPQKSVVSWNSMIVGYEQNGDYVSAIELFCQMRKIGEKPDWHTLSSILSSCAGLVCLYQGMQIHQLVVKTLIPDIPINNALITMYSRCGNIVKARSIFDEMNTEKDFVSWNAIIGGYAQHGLATEAITLFEEMKRMKVEPTHITFISILNACDHSGLVDEGRIIFDSMIQDFSIKPKVEHYAALVDMMGRHGLLRQSLDFIMGMPFEPDKAVWGAFLGACRIHKDINMACIAAEELIKIEPESSGTYMILHNMYVDAGLSDEAATIRRKMEINGVKKQAGYSWIELLDQVHVFISGDQNHSSVDEIHAIVESFNKYMGDIYYEACIY